MKITKNNIDDVRKSKKASVESMAKKGYRMIDELFCDSSGFGAEDELALTYSQLKAKLSEILAENPVIYTKITNAGQFQIYLGIFLKVKDMN